MERAAGRRRWAVAALGSAAIVALLAAIVLGQAGPWQFGTAGPSPGPTQPPAADRTDEPRATAFVPPTSVVDGQRVLTLHFPGGITGEIAYPVDLDLHARGTTPGAQLSIVSGPQDIHTTGRPLVSEKVEAHRGSRDEVVKRINGGQPAMLIAEYPGPRGTTVPLYATSAGDYLAWQAGSWTLLVRDPKARSSYAAPRDPEKDRGTYAANLSVREDPDGWPIVAADPPLRVDDPYVALGASEVALAFARSPAPRLSRELSAGDQMVVVYASACAWIGRVEDSGYVSWCDLATQLSFEVIGPDDIVDSISQRLQPRVSEYPPSIIDPAWVTQDAKEAWQGVHGEGTWVVNYFFVPELIDPEGSFPNEFADALTARWKRIADDARDLSRQARLQAALIALTGPPPPRLAHGWQGRALELRSAEVVGSELVLDFAVLVAGAEGSTGGAMMGAQFRAAALHYYPEASSICVLVDGKSSVWLHDAFTCPSRDLR